MDITLPVNHPNLKSGRLRRLLGPHPRWFQSKVLNKIGKVVVQGAAQAAIDRWGEPDQDSIQNAEESMSPRQRRKWVRLYNDLY